MLFVDYSEHTVFESFFVFLKPILLPSVVKDASIKVVSRHTILKEADAGLVVGLLFKPQRSAVLHELLELTWVAAAELFKRCLYLLFFDVGVFFIFRATWKSLPGKLTLEQIQNNVSYSL